MSVDELAVEALDHFPGDGTEVSDSDEEETQSCEAGIEVAISSREDRIGDDFVGGDGVALDNCEDCDADDHICELENQLQQYTMSVNQMRQSLRETEFQLDLQYGVGLRYIVINDV